MDDISVESTTIDDLLSVIDKVAYEGVKKIMVYYSGKSHNGVGTNFPVIPLKDYELTHPELLDIWKSKGFSIIIIGYNASNKLGTELSPDQDTLQISFGPYFIPSKIFDYKGIMSFTGASIGEEDRVDLFNRWLRNALRVNNGDWLSSMEYLSNNEDFKMNNMTPYWTIDRGMPLYRKWH